MKRGPTGRGEGHKAKRLEPHDGRTIETGQADGCAVSRRFLSERPAVPLRRGHRVTGGRGRAGPSDGTLRVARRRPIVLHAHVGCGPDGPVGRDRRACRDAGHWPVRGTRTVRSSCRP